MKIIVFSGKAGHGKDTSAAILKDLLSADGYRVLITHYADLLKYMCRTFFGWDGKKDDAGRHILQHVGTDVIREKRPDFWVNFIIDVLEFFPNRWDFALIPDCRFPNEIERLKEAGFDVIHLRIVRENFAGMLTEEQQKHPSETALDHYCHTDYRIVNDGSVGDLKRALFGWLIDFTSRHQTASNG